MLFEKRCWFKQDAGLFRTIFWTLLSTYSDCLYKLLVSLWIISAQRGPATATFFIVHRSLLLLGSPYLYSGAGMLTLTRSDMISSFLIDSFVFCVLFCFRLPNLLTVLLIMIVSSAELAEPTGYKWGVIVVDHTHTGLDLAKISSCKMCIFFLYKTFYFG